MKAETVIIVSMLVVGTERAMFRLAILWVPALACVSARSHSHHRGERMRSLRSTLAVDEGGCSGR